MSHPRTVRSRRGLTVAVFAAALTLAACDNQAAVDEVADDLIEESQDQADDVVADDAADGDGDADMDDSGDAEMDDAEMEEMSGAVTGIDYRTCHEKQTAGGNSDGVFVLQTDLSPGTAVEVDILVQDGSTTVPIAGEVGEDGSVVVVAPLTNIGERVEVLGARGPDGSALDIDVATGDATFIVSEVSDCTTHPDND